MWVLIMVTWDMLSVDNLFTMQKIRTVAAVSTWFMWVKVFYWMRLFRSSGYYITLILQTINDIKIFLAMVALILTAFANVFFLLQLNVPAKDADNPILSSYYGSSVIDSFIGMYVMALGDFNYGGFAASANDGVAWIFFLLGTFICLVVFMNMLIAIMGNTFGEVMDHQIENALKENLHLINDHIWLLDLRQEFKNMRYIIRVQPDCSAADDGVDISDQIVEMTNALSKRSDLQNTNVMKRIEAFEKNNRQMQKNQAQKSLAMKKVVFDLAGAVKKLAGEQGNMSVVLTDLQQMLRKHLGTAEGAASE